MKWENSSKMWSRFSVLAVLLHAVLALKRDCPQPCISIVECPDLVKLIQTNAKVVQDATCGFERLTPLVCCPSSTSEPLKAATTAAPTTKSPPTPNPLLPTSCGHFSDGDRVVGGELAQLGNYPWMAALGYNNVFTNNVDFLCGGSVINERYILTAAHCLDRKLDVVRLGEWDLSTDIDCETSKAGFKFCAPEPAQDFTEFETVKHPEYRKRGQVSDDIALIRLASPVKFSKWIHPVCMPERDLDVAAVAGKGGAIVTGWGVTEHGIGSDILMQLEVPFVDIGTCNTTYDNLLVGNQLCFGGVKGKDSCVGDSGGPLVMSEFNSPPFTQVGIVSFGPRRCGTDNVPGVYTSVASYRDWIDENMRP